MRIERLELRAFGAFTDAPPLDFSCGNEGIHIVYGPNEAGKSTALRALTQALYGIPQRSKDDFVHPYAKLRVAMSIHSNGASLAFVRRKGTSGTLREYDDESKAIEEERLLELLYGIDETAFRSLFGLHHEDLVRGGKEILQGGGEIGHALFAAASGLAEVRAIHSALADEADAVFSPRASKPLLNSLLAAFKAKNAELKDAMVSTQLWLEREKELKEAEAHCREIEEACADADKECRRLERFRQALPLLTQRKNALTALKDLGNTLKLREGFPAFWREALTALSSATRSRDTLAAKLETNRIKRDSLRLDKHIVAQSETIQALWKDVNRVLASRNDRQTVLDEARILEFEIQRLLNNIQPGAPIEAAATLRLASKVRREMMRLSNAHAATVRDSQQAREELQRVLRERDTLQDALAREAAPQDTRALEEIVKRVRRAGDLETQLESLQDKIERLSGEVNRQLTRFGAGWQRPLDELESTPVPEAETVERFARDLDEATLHLTQCEERCTRLKAEYSEQEQRVTAFEEGGLLPTEADLTNRRQKRDAGWLLVRRQWEANHPPNDISDEDVSEFAVGMGRPLNLADAFYEAGSVADNTADILRNESSRVAQRAQYEQMLAGISRQLERAQQDKGDAIRAKEEVLRAWAELWKASGINPLLPREMESWLRRREKLLELAKQIRDARCDATRLTATIAHHKDDLRKVIDSLGAEEPTSDASLIQWIDSADFALSDVAARRRTHDDNQNTLSKLTQASLPEAQRTLDAKEKALSDWQAAWKRAMEAMGLPEDADVETAQEIADTYAEIEKNWEQLQMQRKRIDEMTRFETEFSTRARALCEHVAADLVGRPPEQALQELHMRLQSFQDAEKEKSRLDEEEGSLQAELEEITESIMQFEGQLEQACKEARVSAVEMLQEAETRALERQKLEDTLRQLDVRLADLAGGEALDAFIDALDKEDPDSLERRCGELGRHLERLREDNDASVNTAAEQRVRFEDLNRHEEAVRAAESLEELRAEIEDAIDRYLKLKAAEAVLQAAMERYRRENQDPLLTRTAEIFRKLTLSSFADLRTDLDDKGQQVLVGVRNSDKSIVRVDGMSDGSTDQLFLALRLASIEQYASKGKALPFIADDILVNFDDDRARASFEVLAELSKVVQVIFFTHHQHLVELAKECVPEKTLFVQELQV